MTKEDLFGSKPENSDMPDDIWQTYYFLVTVCNSLNALTGSVRHTNKTLAINLERAQASIMFLLEESGRLKRFNEWEERRMLNDK